MAVDRPETIVQYKEWAAAILGFDFSATSTRNRYDSNLLIAQNAIQESSFVRGFPAFVATQEVAYHDKTGAGLLMSSELTVLKKPFESAVTKSFRANILRNRRFPAPPSRGWIGPDNWYSEFDDLVRSTLVCKFLDGPGTLAAALDGFALTSGVTGRHVTRGTDYGYYAFHHYTAFPVEVVDREWNPLNASIQFEIQLTTQLQEVLRELTHPLYEEVRLESTRPDDSWKWDYDTPRFRTSYLGHTLHMIEAVILQARDSTRAAPEGPGAPASPGAQAQISVPFEGPENLG